MSKIFRQQIDRVNSLDASVQRLRVYDESNPMTITLENRANISSEIENDLKLHEEIEKLSWKWTLSSRNRTASDTYYNEVNPNFFVTHKKKIYESLPFYFLELLRLTIIIC